MHVHQRLLTHPEERVLGVRRELSRDVSRSETYLQPASPREPRAELLQGALKSELAQLGRMKEIGEGADLRLRGRQRRLYIQHPRPSFSREPAKLKYACEARIGGDQELRRRIVKLPSDTGALVLL